MNFDSILNQIFQPYFYYSVLFLVISFVCIKVLTRYSHVISQRTKSLLYLVPLVIPLIVMLVFLPSTTIHTTAMQVSTGVPPTTGKEVLTNFGQNLTSQPEGSALITTSHISILSVTGILCIIGLAAGAVFAASMILADDKVARKILHVITLSTDEHQWLQTSVIQLSKNLGITVPKIGIVEDLRPNAFTIGYGKRATVVFSVGLFNVLGKEEMVAVASHELAHLKNRDFFYKVASSALTAVSFFNPLAYIVSSTGQREREMLADECAIEFLEKPSLLGNAIAKICKVIQTLPKESKVVSFSSNLLVTSSITHRLGILSTHPRLDKRLRNISKPKPRHRLNHRNMCLVACLSILILCSAIVVSNAVVNIQMGFAASQAKPQNIEATGYHIVGGSDPGSSGPIKLQFNGAQNMSDSANQSALGATNNPVIYSINSKDPLLNAQSAQLNISILAFP
jgi:heat shock protein HtpX